MCSTLIFAQVNFETYFENKTLRIDYYHTGNSDHDSYSFDEMKEEPFWGGSKINLIDKFNYGKYKFEVIDDSSQQIIYSRTYSTLFGEWQTTDEAKQTEKSFNETVVFPYPKSNVTVIFYGRDKKNNLIKSFNTRLILKIISSKLKGKLFTTRSKLFIPAIHQLMLTL